MKDISEYKNSEPTLVASQETPLEKISLLESGNDDIKTYIIDYKSKNKRIVGFLMQDPISNQDIGYAVFNWEEGDIPNLSINFFKTKRITENISFVPDNVFESIQKSITDFYDALKIYPEYRGKGYGKKIMEYALKYLRDKKGFDKIQVSGDTTIIFGENGPTSFYTRNFPFEITGNGQVHIWLPDTEEKLQYQVEI